MQLGINPTSIAHIINAGQVLYLAIGLAHNIPSPIRTKILVGQATLVTATLVMAGTSQATTMVGHRSKVGL